MNTSRIIPLALVSLASSLCVEAERLSGPVFSVDGAPNPYTDRAFACGDWTVIPSDDGWYGWTPNHPDEQAETAEQD